MTNEEYYIKELENIKQFFTPFKIRLHNIMLLESEAKVPYHYLWLFISGYNKSIKHSHIPNIVKVLEEHCSYNKIKQNVDMVDIQKVVCNYFRLTPQELCRYTRKRVYLQPRQIAMYFSKELTNKTLADIGEFFGGFDHATCLSGIRLINCLIETDREIAAQIEEIRKLLK